VGFTSSAVDAPADRAQIALLPTTELEIHGTVAGASDATGALVCTNEASEQVRFVVVDADVTVKAGAFATTVGASSLPLRRPCRLRLVPWGIATSQYAPFTGPRIVALQADRDYAAPDLGSHVTVTGAGDCGVANLGLSDLGGEEPLTGPDTIGCAARFRPWADDPAAVPSGRSEIRIDGTDAFLRPDGPMTRQRDQATGDVRWSEAHTVVRCTSPVFPLDEAHLADCGALAPTGVRFERSGVAEKGGTVTSVRDTWSATDGAAHELDLLHEFDLVSGPDAGVWFPWMSDWFQQYPVNQPVRGPGVPGPGSFYTRPDGSELGVLGPTTAISYGDAPDRIEWGERGGAMLLPGPSADAELAYARKVAAEEPYRQAFLLSTSARPQVTQWMAVEAEDRLTAPQLSISTPVEGGSAPSGQVEVTGDARDNHGIASLTVNGRPVTRDGDLWRVTLTPPDGPLTVVARAVDGDGNVAVARRSFTVTPSPAAPPPATPAPAPTPPTGGDGPAWVPPPPSPRCVVPQLRGLTLAKARARLRAAHCRTGRIQGRGRKLPRVARVVRQSPRAGTSAPEAAEVALDIHLRRSR
jgi:hypothetical protein